MSSCDPVASTSGDGGAAAAEMVALDKQIADAVIVGNVSDYDGPAPVQFEYLEHTADVQLHSWGGTLGECFEQAATAMFGYMTDLPTVRIQYTYDISATADPDDSQGLLFHFLDEWLFAFSAEPFFIPRRIKMLEFDLSKGVARARGWGESFDLAVHPQGTEVKAITYSNMQVHRAGIDGAEKTEVFVIIDI